MNAKAARVLRAYWFGDFAYHSPREYITDSDGSTRLKPGTRHAGYRVVKRYLRKLGLQAAKGLKK